MHPLTAVPGQYVEASRAGLWMVGTEKARCDSISAFGASIVDCCLTFIEPAHSQSVRQSVRQLDDI